MENYYAKYAHEGHRFRKKVAFRWYVKRQLTPEIADLLEVEEGKI